MAIDEIIDRLYGLPLAEFTAARNEAARELRKAGEREAAERVKALRKPTAAAGAVNRLVREQRGEVEQFLQAAVALRDAQFSGKGDLATATRQEHEALGRLLATGGEAVRQTLLAAAVDDDAARQLREARLERELEPRGFGTLLAHAPQAAVTPAGTTAPQPAPKSPEREAPKPDDRVARSRLGDAEAALTAAETEEREARRRWEVAQHDLERARAAVDTAQRDLDRLHGR
ncbi:MAG TPA: hypothetical protein VFZ86_06435 [Thermoleophilia bacterium]|nr:hypothetical protein [Thermoleophilia bacterium]